MRRVLAVLHVSFLAPCAGARFGTIVSPRLDRSIASDNGSGGRALGNQADATITARVSPIR